MKLLNSLVFSFLAMSMVNSYSQVVYTDINPDATATIMFPGSQFDVVEIDFDGMNGSEYNYRWDATPQDWFLHMTSTGSQMNLKGATTNPFGARYIEPMMEGDVIDSSLNWGYSGPEPLIGDVNDSNFQSLGDRFIGCQFTIGSNTHYGWVRVSLDGDLKLTIKDYAYESTPDKAINAGDASTTAGVADYDFNSLFNVYPIPASNVLNVSPKNSTTINNVSIVTIDGRLAYTSAANYDVSKGIDVSGLSQGIYILKIEFEGRILNKKIIIK